MGNNYTIALLLILLNTIAYSQTNAYKWTFNKFDKDRSGEITFRELKCNGFFKYDKNGNLKLSRFEFWRLKNYQKRQLRQYERILKRGLYTKYFKHALQPLVSYKPEADTYYVLNGRKR